VLLREAGPEDARAAARLLVDVFPHLPVTSRRIRQRMTNPLPGESARHVAALDGDRLVGWARSLIDVNAVGPSEGHVLVTVAPPWRNRGVGSALLVDAERHLSLLGVRTLRSSAIDSEDIRRFCAIRGWHPERWTRYLSLDLERLVATPRPLVPEGVQVLPAWVMEDLRPLYEAHAECALDEPRDVRPRDLSYLGWLEEVWHAPDHDPSSGMVAVVGGTVASFALFTIDRSSGRIWSTMTGTRRGYRGRGLATLVKAVALHRAAERGFRLAWTAVEAENAPMAAVNQRLGYRLALTQVMLVRYLDSLYPSWPANLPT